MIRELEETMRRRDERIEEIRAALLNFALPDENFSFTIDPQYRMECCGYIEEIQKLREANNAARVAIARSVQVAENLTKAGLISGNSKDVVMAIGTAISNLNFRRGVILDELARMNQINPTTLIAEVPEEYEVHAEELKSEVKEIPDKIASLKEALDEMSVLFSKLPNRPAPQKNFGRLPSRKKGAAP